MLLTAGYTEVLAVVTVIIPPSLVTTFAEMFLVPRTVNVIHPDRPRTAPVTGAAGSLPESVTQAPANHTSINVIVVVITYRPPLIIVVNLYTSCSVVRSVSKSDRVLCNMSLTRQ